MTQAKAGIRHESVNSSLTRRAVLGATAAALAGGAAINLAAIAAAKAETVIPEGQFPDPIFALIERHRAALLLRLETQRIACLIGDELLPDDAAAEPASDAAFAACEEAAADLAETVPTTMAGVAALLDHILAITTRGSVFPAADPKWCSGIWSLPHWPAPGDGHNLYPFEIMQSVRTALAGQAVAS